MERKTVNIYAENEESMNNIIEELENNDNVEKIEVFDLPLNAFWKDEAENAIRGFFSDKQPDDIENMLETHLSNLCNEFTINSESIIDIERQHNILKDLIK